MADTDDCDAMEEASSLAPRHVYEVIRAEGDEELSRPTKSLIWSGVAAGVMISFSIVGEAIFRTHLPEGPSRFLIENLGYCLGFLLVILGRLQLFTENTMTTVFPLVALPNRRNFWRVGRLWGIVLLANVVGTCAAAAVIMFTSAVPAEILPAVFELSEHALGFPPGVAFARAIPAGVLIAAVVWMKPQSVGFSFFMIATFTWLIAAGDFTHVVAGSVEMWVLLLTAKTGAGHALFAFFLPVLLGNIVGGAGIFTLMAWGQVQEEVDNGA